MKKWQEQILEMTKNQENKLLMKTFKINFLDIDGNDIYSKVDTFYDEQDASKYASHKLATTSDECVIFEIYEL